MRLGFTKMEGLGNDYVYVDARRFCVEDPAALSVRLSDRHFGIGGDGLVLIGDSPCADFSMRMFNADGSEGAMCGNAARCIGKYVYDKGLTTKRELTLDTLSGVKQLSLHIGEDGLVESVTVGMGSYRIEERELELEAAGAVFRGSVVNVGNPHFVIFCPDSDVVELEKYGPALECHPCFPGKTNVEFASLAAPGVLRLRIWERGSGITMACGTGACATVAAAVARGVAQSPCEVRMDGGSLQVSCKDDGTLLMKGPARFVFEGSVEI